MANTPVYPVIEIKTKYNKITAVVDTMSVLSYVSNRLVRQLALNLRPIDTPLHVIGLGGTKT